jgi:predicted metal-dependent HD superfamily phosphohydrolase
MDTRPPQDLVNLVGYDVATAVITGYSVPARRYHTFGHATAVAALVIDLGGSRACQLAAWFHDIVYVPGSTTNETDSADVLCAALPGDPDAARAAQLVQMTAAHAPDPSDHDACVLADADLAILGSAPSRYERYRTAVRAEHADVDDGAWAGGRAAVLTSLLARDPLFHTPVGHERYEVRARRNMTNELAALGY